MDKFLKYSNNIIALYTYITNNKIISIGNSYRVEMPNIIFKNLPDTNYLITTRHLQSLTLIEDYDNLNVQYNENEIIIKQGNFNIIIPIVDNIINEDEFNDGNTLLTIDDKNLLNKLYKFKRLYKESEIELNTNNIECRADSLTMNIQIENNNENIKNVHLHYILGLINPDKLIIKENALVAIADDIELIASTKILDENPDLIIESAEANNEEFIDI